MQHLAAVVAVSPPGVPIPRTAVEVREQQQGQCRDTGDEGSKASLCAPQLGEHVHHNVRYWRPVLMICSLRTAVSCADWCSVAHHAALPAASSLLVRGRLLGSLRALLPLQIRAGQVSLTRSSVQASTRRIAAGSNKRQRCPDSARRMFELKPARVLRGCWRKHRVALQVFADVTYNGWTVAQRAS